jgi:hypothetical protein
LTTRQPAEPRQGGSEWIRLIRWILDSWPRVLRAVVLVAAPIVGIMIFVGIAVTVIFYLKVDPQRWGAVAGLGVVTAIAAKAIQSLRGWLTGRRELSAPTDGTPAGPQQVSGPEDDAGPAGEDKRNDDVGN